MILGATLDSTLPVASASAVGSKTNREITEILRIEPFKRIHTHRSPLIPHDLLSLYAGQLKTRREMREKRMR